MTFILVQVSHRRRLPLVVPDPILFLVNSVDWLDEQNSSDRDDLLSLGLLRGESLLSSAGSRFGTEFSADFQIFLLAYSSDRCCRLDHHVFHRLCCLRFDCDRNSNWFHLYATFKRFPPRFLGFDFPSSDLPSGWFRTLLSFSSLNRWSRWFRFASIFFCLIQGRNTWNSGVHRCCFSLPIHVRRSI